MTENDALVDTTIARQEIAHVELNGQHFNVYCWKRAVAAGSNAFLEIQVWKKRSDGSASLLLDFTCAGATPDENRPLRISSLRHKGHGVLKLRVECNRGLRVKGLFLVAVLRFGNTMYISSPTEFPPPSTIRAKAKNPPPSSPPLPTLDASLLNDACEEVENQWTLTNQRLQALFPNDSKCTRVLHQLLKKQCDLERQTSETDNKRIILIWLENAENVPKVITPMLEQRCFYGCIDPDTALSILSSHCRRRPMDSVFLLRFSQSKPASIAVDALYKGLDGMITYHARIHVGLDETQPGEVLLFVDTEKDRDSSRCNKVSSIIEFIEQRTRWKPLNHVSYDDIGLPPPQIMSNEAYTNVPYQNFQAHAVPQLQPFTHNESITSYSFPTPPNPPTAQSQVPIYYPPSQFSYSALPVPYTGHQMLPSISTENAGCEYESWSSLNAS